LNEQGIAIRGSSTLLRVDQPDGFGGPGCAWPGPKHASSFEFCESSAWYMCHRALAAPADEGFLKPIGIVEIDESVNGGKANNRRGRFPLAPRLPSREMLRLRYR